MSNESYTYLPDINTALSDIPPDSIVSRTLYQGKTMRVVLFGFAAGQELSEHTSTKEAVLHFLRGEAELTLGTETVVAQNGTLARMAPHLPHTIRARTETWMLLYMFR